MRLASVLLILLFLASCAPENSFETVASVQSKSIEPKNAELDKSNEKIKSLEDEIRRIGERNKAFWKETNSAVQTKNSCYSDLNYWKNLAQKAQALLTEEQQDKLDSFYTED